MSLLPRWGRGDSQLPSTLDGLDELFHSVLKGLNLDLTPEILTKCNCPPKLEVTLKGHDVVAEIPLAGYKNDEIDIEVVGDMLTVRAEHTEKCEEQKDCRFLRRERCFAAYEESVRLPVLVKGASAKAQYKDGVLTVTMPRKDAEAADSHIVSVE